MNIKLIVTDLDNTFLRHDKTVSDYTVQVFQHIRNRGILIAFATARDFRVTIQPLLSTCTKNEILCSVENKKQKKIC